MSSENLDWSESMPDSLGKWQMRCAETDQRPEDTEVIFKRGELFCELDGLCNPVKYWHDGLTDVTWRRKDKSPQTDIEKFLFKVVNRPKHIQKMMVANKLKFYDLSNPMQKLAFSIYTELCELSMEAGHILESLTPPSSAQQICGEKGQSNV